MSESKELGMEVNESQELDSGAAQEADSGENEYKELDLEELYLQMQDDLYDGIKEEIPIQVKEALSRAQGPQDILDSGLVAGMDIVGVDFRDGILFVPEVLMAANAMKAGMEIIRPLLTETGAPQIGKMVVGTVKGDIHDIGKNLVAMMMEGAGFEVINLGINCDADKFIEAIKEHQPDILGMSALLTTTMPFAAAFLLASKQAAFIFPFPTPAITIPLAPA